MLTVFWSTNGLKVIAKLSQMVEIWQKHENPIVSNLNHDIFVLMYKKNNYYKNN